MAVMEHSPEDARHVVIHVVKPKRCRTGKKEMQKLLTTIEGLTKHNAVLHAKYDIAVHQGAVALAERDVARCELRVSENTSAHRLLLIKNEVRHFSRKVLHGEFECYAAEL